MIIIILLVLLLIALLMISFYTYRMVFYSAKGQEEPLYHLPQGSQYEKHHPNIQKSIDEMLALPFEAVYITSFDGTKLYARYYHVRDGAPLQIQFHGYKSSSTLDFCGGCKLARKLGHNALIVDQRAHGKSEGNTITFGIKERRDCLCWINYARERFGENIPIILSGLSMGAATVLMATDLELPDNVIGIIADCPYSSPKEIIQKVSRDLHLPPGLVFPFIRLGAFLFGHFNLMEGSAITALNHAKIPVLLIHGEDDRFVPCEMSKELQAACASPFTLVTIPDAGHGLCYLTDPVLYEEATMKFINSICNYSE